MELEWGCINIVFDVLREGVREGPPWDRMYADDMVLMDESKENHSRIWQRHGRG